MYGNIFHIHLEERPRLHNGDGEDGANYGIFATGANVSSWSILYSHWLPNATSDLIAFLDPSDLSLAL